MKTFYALSVRALICFLPSLLAGQTIQQQYPLLEMNSLQGLQMNSSQIVGSPLLRLSNIGDMGMDGIKLELNALDLMSPGPTVFLDCPDPLIPGSGAIRLMPSDASSFLRISNIGSSGQDGVAIDLGEAVIAPYRPRLVMRKPLVAGTQSALIIEPGEDTPYLSIDNLGSSGQDGVRIGVADPLLPSFFDVYYDLSLGIVGTGFGNNPNNICAIVTFDPVTPKVNERFTGTAVDNFFDVFYDLSLGKKGTGFGNNPDNLCLVSTFDPVHPSLLERLTSNLTDVPSFFDVFTDLEPLSHTHQVGLVGDPDFDLLRITSFEIDTPRVRERIETLSSDPSWTEHFFDVYYDLELGSINKGFGNNPDNICAITTFDPSSSRLEERVTASTSESFFDVFTDLEPLGHTHKVGLVGDPDFDLLRITSFEIDTPRVRERIETLSSDPSWADHFFDITYDLELGSINKGFGNNPDNICCITTFDPSTAKLRERITASTVPSFFDVFVDLDLGTETRRLGTMGDPDFDLLRVTTYDKATPKLWEHISSNDAMVESFFDVFVDLELGTETRRMEATHPDFTGSYIEKTIDLELIPLSLTRVGFPPSFPPVAPLEVRYEYDGLARKVREVTSNSGGGVPLIIERQLEGPPAPPFFGQPTLVIAGNLQVNGAFASPAKFFKIDHPLDPDNKYLFHSCIESPDMMNVYNGNATTDDNGYVTITLPDYFEALNSDFRYQLTCMGQFAQAIVDQKIQDNHFVVRTDKPNVEVSWQVTGIRKDPASNRDAFAVEVEKEPEMKGKRLYQQP